MEDPTKLEGKVIRGRDFLSKDRWEESQESASGGNQLGFEVKKVTRDEKADTATLTGEVLNRNGSGSPITIVLRQGRVIKVEYQNTNLETNADPCLPNAKHRTRESRQILQMIAQVNGMYDEYGATIRFTSAAR